MTAKRKFQILMILLVVVVALAVLFATGTLRFGLSGPFVYIVYVLAGLLSAFLTFGVLSSRGELHGERDGVGLKLGGAVVALVVVAAGGGFYERYLYTPPQFDVLILFFTENQAKAEPVTGKLALIVGNQDFAKELDGTGRVLFRGISSRYLQQPFQIQLDSPNYEVISNLSARLPADAPVLIKVQWKRTWEPANKAEIRIFLESGSAMNYGPRPDQKNVNFRLKVESVSPLPIPISKRATVRLLTNDGAPLESWVFEVVGERTVIPPKAVAYVHVDGMVPKDAYHRIRIGKMVTISLAYDPDIEASDVQFRTLPSEMSDSNFEDYAKEKPDEWEQSCYQSSSASNPFKRFFQVS